MNYKICLSLLLFLQAGFAYAEMIKSYTIRADSVCSGENSLMVIPGHEMPQLLGARVDKLSLLSLLHNKRQMIVFQIDQKDSQGRFTFSKNSLDNSQTSHIMGIHDELVFRKKDLGEHLHPSSELFAGYSLIEIEVISESADSGVKKASGWIYIALNSTISAKKAADFNLQNESLIYEPEEDTVISPIYKIGFSKDQPFLLDAFHWRLPDRLEWSHDVTDKMKIRHIGKFLGFPFKRTDDDYYSQLVDIKAGPLRVIRRTENKVKVFWKLKSPALYIDYVMLPDGFIMDSIIDIPFKISFFFSGLQTMTSMDWNNAPELPGLTIKSVKPRLTLPVNGQPSDDKDAFNQIAGREFSLSSKPGRFAVKLDIPSNFPIHSQLYLRDALHEIDLPENYPGQFGNVGFKTTGWENIDSKLHHLKFTVCVDRI